MTTQATPRRKRFRFRWRVAFGILVLLLTVACIAGVFIFGRRYVQGNAEPQVLIAQEVPVERRELLREVLVNAALEPRTRSRVSFADGVRVREVLVKAGDRVTQGQVLARLETRDLDLEVSSAKAKLDQAQRTLDDLQKGPTEAELAAAAAKVARARANIAVGKQEVRQIDIDNAKRQLELARANLADLQRGVAPDELTAAEKQALASQTALTDAQLGLDRTRDKASRAKIQAQQTMEQGAQKVQETQRAFGDARRDWDYVQRTGRHPTQTIVDAKGREEHVKLNEREREDFHRKLDDAIVALKNAETELDNLKLAYQDALTEEVRQVQESERAFATSQRALDDAQKALETQRTKGMAQALLTARKAVADAEKAYNDLTANPDRAASRAEREAALLQAQEDQEKLSSGPDPDKQAEARTALESARAALAKAEAELDAATLRATITGTVVDITLEEGTVTATNDAVSIADLRSFLVRGQVIEDDVVQVQIGQKVAVNVDSVPGATFDGQVLRVSELPEEAPTGSSVGPGGGNSVGALGGLYPVDIEVKASDQRLRVGMATTASIRIFSIPNALVVPLQAVQYTPEGDAFVFKSQNAPVPVSGSPTVPQGERTSVEVGKISGDSIQILKGLSEGDRVILQQLPPAENGGFGGRS